MTEIPWRKILVGSLVIGLGAGVGRGIVEVVFDDAPAVECAIDPNIPTIIRCEEP